MAILPFPDRLQPTQSGGDGPMDPTIEARVGRLEEQVGRIELILTRLEPRITELAFAGAKAAEMQKIQIDVAEVKGRVSSLPTWWMLMISLLTTWLAGAGIVFTLIKAGHS